jgi:hypothetical protein
MTAVTRHKLFALPGGLDGVTAVLGVDVGTRNMGWCVAERRGADVALRHGLFDGSPDPLAPNVSEEDTKLVAGKFARAVLRDLDPARVFVAIEQQIPFTADGSSSGECMAVESGLRAACDALGFRAMSVDPSHVKAFFADAFPTAGDYDANKGASHALMHALYTRAEAADVAAVVAAQVARRAGAADALRAERHRLVAASDAAAAALVAARAVRDARPRDRAEAPRRAAAAKTAA